MDADLVYDVGLHRGEDTAYYLKKGYRVVAFEANPELVAHCSRRFSDAIADGRLHIVEGAIAPPSAGPTVTFYRNAMSIWGTIDDEWVTRNEKIGFGSTTVEVGRVDVADAFATHGVPYFLKIDIEGADTLVLDALQAFEARPQYVSIESEKVHFPDLVRELEMLGALGYTTFRPVQQRTVPGTAIRTRSLDGHPVEHVFEADASGPFGDDLDLEWLTMEEILLRYRRIFRRYRWIGDNVSLPRRVLRRLLRTGLGYEVGWYDTHASL